jgi:predicted O-methyltransferase YrrM
VHPEAASTSGGTHTTVTEILQTENTYVVPDHRERIYERALLIPGWFSRDDMIAVSCLIDEYVRDGGQVVEVGCWKGRSSYVLAAVAAERGISVRSIDTFRGIPEKHVHNKDLYGESREREDFSKVVLENLKEFSNFDIIVGDSRETYIHLWDESVDMIFIDGDHGDPTISLDLQNYWPKVRLGGVLCGHDYDQEDVGIAVRKKFSVEPDEDRPQFMLFVNTRIWLVEKRNGLA